MVQVTAAPTTSDPPSGSVDGAGAVQAPALRGFVFALFFIFGGVTSLNDVIIPKLKELFTLSYAEAMLVQSGFFAAYFLISIPASASGAFVVFLGAPFGPYARPTLQPAD